MPAIDHPLCRISPGLGLAACLVLWPVALYAGVSDAPVNDADVVTSIERAVEFLWSRQNTTAGDRNEGSWVPAGQPVVDPGDVDGNPMWNYRAVGETALIVYALLEWGIHPNDARMKKALDWLVAQQVEATRHVGQWKAALKAVRDLSKSSEAYDKLTQLELEAFEPLYNVALRANALYTAIRRNKNATLEASLRQDVRRLVEASNNGGYGYITMTPEQLKMKSYKRMLSWNNPPRFNEVAYEDFAKTSEFRTDNSNSQYGLLGVWAGQKANMEIPLQYWQQVEEFWKTQQNPDGGWGYGQRTMRKRSYPSMTVAGVASLFVCLDYLKAREFLRCDNNNEYDPHLQKGLERFENVFPRSMQPGADMKPSGRDRGSAVYRMSYYYLYGVERVALACGYKDFGGLGWYSSGARYILSRQKANGSWDGEWNDGNTLGATAYAMLFLARGRRPVLFNKLQFDSDWNNRPRDMANLTRWISDNYEADLNWQIVKISSPPESWHDAPILYISGAKAPNFTPEQIDKLRTFVWQGGTIFAVTEGNGSPFTKGIDDACATMFPQFEWTRLEESHPLYSIQYTLRPRYVPFRQISNGLRPLVVHTTRDLPMAWQSNQYHSRKIDFQAGANIFFYVAPADTLLGRGQRTWPPEQAATGKTVRMVQLKYGGLWNPEPLAWQGFARRLAADANVQLVQLDPVAPSQLGTTEADLAVLTGLAQIKLTASDKAALKEFVTSGGVLLVDAAGGSRTFFEAVQEQLGEAFAGKQFKTLPISHPMYNLPDRTLREVKYRLATQKRGVGPLPQLQAMEFEGQPRVLLSREDLTAGLVGVGQAGLDGYAPADAFHLVRNIILHTQSIEADRPGKAAPSGGTMISPASPARPDASGESDRVAVVSWKDAGQHIGREVTVEGRIVGTGATRSGSITFLNFSRNRGDFTVKIFERYKKNFPQDPQRMYRGKTVRVTGRVGQYKGEPDMEIRRPEQVQIVESQ